VPLLKKRVKRNEREAREAERLPVVPQDSIVYVHNPARGVTLPPHPDKVFAVVRMLGR
jgi:hypothetical protein